jgi:hypothetical protein
VDVADTRFKPVIHGQHKASQHKDSTIAWMLMMLHGNCNAAP